MPDTMTPSLLDGVPRALFLDFDGTLVDIAETPEAIIIDPGLPEILIRLKNRLEGALAIISGRSIAFLDNCLKPYHFDIGGLHGLEQRIGSRWALCDPDNHPSLRKMLLRLEEAVASRSGVLLEDKGCSIAIHWRLAPQERDFALKLARDASEVLGPEYQIQYGKAVAEILPAAANKGKIIETFLQQAPYRGRKPVFIGDDLTDEKGFAVVNRHGGLSIRVGQGETAAQERLAAPADLRHILSLWSLGEASPFLGSVKR